jgi:hypothetical protein
MPNHWGMYNFNNPTLAYIHGYKREEAMESDSLKELIRNLRKVSSYFDALSEDIKHPDQPDMCQRHMSSCEAAITAIEKLQRDLEIARGARSCEECQPTQEYQEVVERLARKK